MKKIIAIILSAFMAFGCLNATAFAGNSSATVYVSIADKGNLVASQVEVSVTDIDSDGSLTVNDALYVAHEAVYSGGAKSGYEYYTHKDYGLSLGKLWGDSSGNFGYYLNNNSCWDLSDAIKDGDYLNAFVYSDGKYYSDKYCFFDEYTVSAKSNSEIELILKAAGYDANWNPVTLPVSGAEITVDGIATGVFTDAEGKAIISIDDLGAHIISAVSTSENLVPPVCTVKVSNGIFASVISVIVSIFETIINFFLSLIK